MRPEHDLRRISKCSTESLMQDFSAGMTDCVMLDIRHKAGSGNVYIQCLCMQQIAKAS